MGFFGKKPKKQKEVKQPKPPTSEPENRGRGGVIGQLNQSGAQGTVLGQASTAGRARFLS